MRVIFREEGLNEDLATIEGVAAYVPQQGDEISIQWPGRPTLFKVVKNRFFLKPGKSDNELICFVRFVPVED